MEANGSMKNTQTHLDTFVRKLPGRFLFWVFTASVVLSCVRMILSICHVNTIEMMPDIWFMVDIVSLSTFAIAVIPAMVWLKRNPYLRRHTLREFRHN